MTGPKESGDRVRSAAMKKRQSCDESCLPTRHVAKKRRLDYRNLLPCKRVKLSCPHRAPVKFPERFTQNTSTSGSPSHAMLESMPMEILYMFLRLLRAQDVIRLSQCSRRLHHFFGSEDVFSFLCKRDFNVNVPISNSYFLSFKLLHSACHLTQIDLLNVRQLEKIFGCDLPPICNTKVYSSIRDDLLHVLPTISTTFDDSLTSSGAWSFLCPQGTSAFARTGRAKKLFPFLSSYHIRRHYTGPKLTFSRQSRYNVGALKKLAIQKLGSLSRLQAYQLERLFKKQDVIMALLPYYHRQERLHELTVRILRHCPGMTTGVLCPVPLVEGDGDISADETTDVCDEHFEATVKICREHPALKLFLKNALPTTLDNYICAVGRFERYVDRVLPACHAFRCDAKKNVYQSLVDILEQWPRSRPLSEWSLYTLLQARLWRHLGNCTPVYCCLVCATSPIVREFESSRSAENNCSFA